jgi:hypothetical protein
MRQQPKGAKEIAARPTATRADLWRRQTGVSNMLNEVTRKTNNVPAKFKKGKYYIDDNEVPLGHQYIAHATQWVKCWIKFVDGKVADRRMGKVADGYIPPERDGLDDNEPTKWELGLDGKPRDPWSFQYLVPMEDAETGELCVFTTSSFGGRRAVADLAKAYGIRAKKGLRGLPIVGLHFTDMPTKAYGPVPRPDFRVEGWEFDDGGNDDMKVVTATNDLNDSIPF